MKKILILSLILIAVGCKSSGAKNTDAKTTAQIKAEEESDSASVNPTADEKISPVEKKIDRVEKNKRDGVVAIDSAPVKSSGDRLTEAIRTQGDESIMAVATDLLGQNGKDIRAMNALAVVYLKRGKLEASEYLLKKAIAINAQNSELYNNLGLVKLSAGERREAIKAFKKGLDINSNDHVIGANLGALYLAEKSYTKAELALEVAASGGTKDFKVLNNYAVSLVANGKVDKAGEIYEKLMRDNSGKPDIMLNYSIYLIEQKQKYKEGLDLLNRLKFVGTPLESRNIIKDLESKAKAGLK